MGITGFGSLPYPSNVTRFPRTSEFYFWALPFLPDAALENIAGWQVKMPQEQKLPHLSDL